MTTANRPTYHSAVGKSFNGSLSHLVSGKDQTAHTKLKFRQFGQNSVAEILGKDFKNQLDKNEAEVLANKNKDLVHLLEEEKKVDVKLLMDKPEVDPDKINKYDDADADLGDSDKDLENSR